MARAKDPKWLQCPPTEPDRELNTGKPYEIAAVEFFRQRYGDRYQIRHDVDLPNDDGGFEQIDILIELPALGEDTFKTAVEAKDHGRALGKDAVRAIHARFQAASVHTGVIVCARGLSSGGQTALDKARNPKIELHVKTREQLIEGAWGSDFLDALPALRNAKNETAPDAATIRRVVLAIETFPYYARYFFHENSNPSWVPILASEGVIGRAFTGDDRVLASEMGEYVSRFADGYPVQFLNMVDVAGRADQWTKNSILEAALRCPRQVRRKVVRAASKWNFHAFMFVDSVANVVLAAFRDGAVKDGLALLSAVTKIEAERVDKRRTLVRLSAPIDDYWFAEATRDLFPRLAESGAAATLNYARKRLTEALRREYPRLKGEMPTFVYHHVGIPEEYGPNGITEILLYAYRDTLLRAAEIDSNVAIVELRTVFSERRSGGAVRCGLYALGERLAELRPMLKVVLEEDAFWKRDDYLPEMETMVETAWPGLDDVERERIVGRVLDLGPFDYGWSPEPEDAERWRRIHQVQWLIRLEPLGWPLSLADEAQEALNRLRDETGITMLPDRGGVRTMFLDREPDVAKTFGTMTATEILAACRTLQTERRGFDDTTPYGASTTLRTEVSRRPEEFASLPDEMFALPFPCYANAIIDGLAEALAARKVSAKRAAETAERLLRIANPEVKERSSSDVGSARWTCTSAARLIEAACQRHGAEETDLPALLSLWLGISGQERNTDAESEVDLRRNVLETAMNSIDGSLSLALGALTMRALHLSADEERGEASRAIARGIYEDARQLVESFVLRSTLPHVRGPIGVWVTGFFLLDRDWIEARLDRFFDKDPTLWGAVWERCLDFRMAIEVFFWLRPQYRRGLEMLRTHAGEPPQWAEPMARNLTIAWMMGELKEGDDLFKRLLRDAPPSALDTGAMVIQRHLERSPENRELWNRAIRFWELVTGRKDRGGRSRERMAYWLRNAPDSVTLASVEGQLVASLESERDVLPEHTLQFVLSRSSQEPEVAVRVLRAIAETVWRWARGDFVALMTEALRRSEESGDEEVRSTVRGVKVALLKRGYFQFGKDPS